MVYSGFRLVRLAQRGGLRFLKQKLTTVDGVSSIESSFALEQVKYTNVLPIG